MTGSYAERAEEDSSSTAIAQAEVLAVEVFGEEYVHAESPVLGITDNVVIAPNFAASMQTKSGAIVEMLYGEEGELLAFAQAFPISVFDPRRTEKDVAYLYMIVVRPGTDSRGHGLSWVVNDQLLGRLRGEGYQAIEADVTVESGDVPFASAMERRYGDAVTRLGEDYNPWGYAVQRPLRIDIGAHYAQQTDIN